ncbi:MAG: hypothetical protein BWY45_02356 [Euryarchaeota archaeon ADurb.Bin294]|nr:MAG: hypothetical protein BWY45_02356 [Euryarchaeota archaeon ADurb.Bin294]
MGSEEITGEEDLIFRTVGNHGLRPVNPGIFEELKSHSSKV